MTHQYKTQRLCLTLGLKYHLPNRKKKDKQNSTCFRICMYATDKASRKTIWCWGAEDKYQRPACQIQNNHQRLGTLVTSGTSAGAENTQIQSKYKYKYNVWGHWSPKQKCCCVWKVVFCASFRHPTRSVVVVWAEQCWALSAAFPHFTHPDAHLSASTAPIVSSDEWAHVASLNFFVSSLFELIFCHQSPTFELIYQHGPDSELRWVSSREFFCLFTFWAHLSEPTWNF